MRCSKNYAWGNLQCNRYSRKDSVKSMNDQRNHLRKVIKKLIKSLKIKKIGRN